MSGPALLDSSDPIQSRRPVYPMAMKPHGGCRYGGSPFAIEAVAVEVLRSSGNYILEAQYCVGSVNSTSQRSELKAIIGALYLAREKAKTLGGQALMDVTIYTDSQYAYGCMTDWEPLTGGELHHVLSGDRSNRDVIEYAFAQEEKLMRNGWVTYVLIDKDENQAVRERVDKQLDERERERERERDWHRMLEEMHDEIELACGTRMLGK